MLEASIARSPQAGKEVQMTTQAVRAPARDAYAAPVETELEAFDLPVSGALPPELCGQYVRNGPNPRPGSPPAHLFLGDGMLHGIRLEGGRARWYRNRWVRTRAFVENAPYLGRFGEIDLTVGVANTNVISHAGRTLALVESSYPCEVTPELDTLGVYDFAGKLKSPFTAHPKRCPRTGELHAFGMRLFPRALTYLRIDAAGTLIESRPIPVKKATMMHDFALTEHYAIFMDLPVVFDLKRVMMKEFPYRWSDRYGARLGVVSRNDPSAPVRWLEVEPCYVFHVLNAYEDDGRIVIDVVRYRELWRKTSEGFGPTSLHRWTLDPARGTVSEATLSDRGIEFPRCDERRAGSAHRYGYAVRNALERGEETPGGALAKFDLHAGGVSWHEFGPGRRPGEAVFVPAADDAAEDAGWLMCFVYDEGTESSEFVVLDASRPEGKPVAVVPLPQRVPLGFHGNWIPDDAAAGH
jgi:carotenoid cleavage dioxygenase